jgi:hemerythrin
MIKWTSDFETGSATLDEQHQLLIDHINLLENSLHITNPTREQAEFAMHLVDYLEAYADIHFKDEEDCMASCRCPAQDQNRKEHELFRGFVSNYRQLSKARGFTINLLRNLHASIESWIKTHILKIDTQLKPCIAKQASRG